MVTGCVCGFVTGGVTIVIHHCDSQYRCQPVGNWGSEVVGYGRKHDVSSLGRSDKYVSCLCWFFGFRGFPPTAGISRPFGAENRKHEICSAEYPNSSVGSHPRLGSFAPSGLKINNTTLVEPTIQRVPWVPTHGRDLSPFRG